MNSGQSRNWIVNKSNPQNDLMTATLNLENTPNASRAPLAHSISNNLVAHKDDSTFSLQNLRQKRSMHDVSSVCKLTEKGQMQDSHIPNFSTIREAFNKSARDRIRASFGALSSEIVTVASINGPTCKNVDDNSSVTTEKSELQDSHKSVSKKSAEARGSNAELVNPASISSDQSYQNINVTSQSAATDEIQPYSVPSDDSGVAKYLRTIEAFKRSEEARRKYYAELSPAFEYTPRPCQNIVVPKSVATEKNQPYSEPSDDSSVAKLRTIEAFKRSEEARRKYYTKLSPAFEHTPPCRNVVTSPKSSATEESCHVTSPKSVVDVPGIMNTNSISITHHQDSNKKEALLAKYLTPQQKVTSDNTSVMTNIPNQPPEQCHGTSPQQKVQEERHRSWETIENIKKLEKIEVLDENQEDKKSVANSQSKFPSKENYDLDMKNYQELRQNPDLHKLYNPEPPVQEEPRNPWYVLDLLKELEQDP